VQQPHLRSSDEQPWQLVTRRRTWHRVTRLAPPPVPRRLVPSDIVGHCFNGLRIDHVAAACTHPPCYLCCHREGHLAVRVSGRERWMRTIPRRRCSALRSWFSSRGWVTSLWQRRWLDTHPACRAQLEAPKGAGHPRHQTSPRNPHRKDPHHITPAPVRLHRPRCRRLLHHWGPYIEGRALKCRLFHEQQTWLLRKKNCAPLWSPTSEAHANARRHHNFIRSLEHHGCMSLPRRPSLRSR
jgi:hypothetical protein